MFRSWEYMTARNLCSHLLLFISAKGLDSCSAGRWNTQEIHSCILNIFPLLVLYELSYQGINRALNKAAKKKTKRKKKSCFLLTTHRMIANNRNHNHMRELQVSFCKLIVIFFLGFFFFFLPFGFEAQVSTPLGWCLPYNRTSWRRKEKKLHFFWERIWNALACPHPLPCKWLMSLWFHAVTSSLMEEKEHCPKWPGCK